MKDETINTPPDKRHDEPQFDIGDEVSSTAFVDCYKNNVAVVLGLTVTTRTYSGSGVTGHWRYQATNAKGETIEGAAWCFLADAN